MGRPHPIHPRRRPFQQAQPSTFGHDVLAFAYPALRDAERLLEVHRWVNRSPGEAGCVNGSRQLLDRGRIARLLGFDDVIAHTRYAMWQTDWMIDLMASPASLITNLGKLAEASRSGTAGSDFVLAYTRAGVLMPQKRNAYALLIVRGAAGILIGRLSGLLAVVKTPSAARTTSSSPTARCRGRWSWPAAPPA